MVKKIFKDNLILAGFILSISFLFSAIGIILFPAMSIHSFSIGIGQLEIYSYSYSLVSGVGGHMNSTLGAGLAIIIVLTCILFTILKLIIIHRQHHFTK